MKNMASAMEDSHSGRVRHLGKVVRCHSLRGFESLILRHRYLVSDSTRVFIEIIRGRNIQTKKIPT